MVKFNVNGAGFKGFTVEARPDGFTAGVWHEGALWTPDRAAIRCALPYRLRKAFDRAGTLWFPKSARLSGPRIDVVENERPQGHMALHDYRGRYMTTLYANGEAC